MWNIIALTLLASNLSFAQTKEETIRKIEASYNPSITFREKHLTPSLYGCSMSQVEISGLDPVNQQERKVMVKQYYPVGVSTNKTRTVIILPPTGGENIIDRGYANELCSSGIRALILQSWEWDTLQEIDMEMHDRGALRSLAAIRHVIEYIQPSYPEQLGILGTSVGAISSALAQGYEERISAAALIVGGVGMTEIIGNTNEQNAAKLRAERMKHFGFSTHDEYLTALGEAVDVEPADFLQHSGEKKTLVVLATEDVTVPTKNQWDLVKGLQNPEIIELQDDHVGAIKNSFLWRKKEIVQFFYKSLRDR